jgi:hypothetical protein
MNERQAAVAFSERSGVTRGAVPSAADQTAAWPEPSPDLLLQLKQTTPSWGAHIAPVKANNALVGAHIAPVKANNAPVKANIAPVKANNAPVKANNAPVKANNAPVKANIAPVKANIAPVKANNAPVKANNAPVKANNAPVKANNALIETHIAPVLAIMALVLANIAKDLGDVSSLWPRIGEGLLDADGFFDGLGGQTRIFATLSSATRSARLPGPDRTKMRLSSTTPKETPPEERPAPPIIRLDATGRIWPSCSRKNGWEPSLTGMRGGCEPHEAPPRTGRSPWWWRQGSRLP